MKRFAVIVGARPNFIKLAPLMHRVNGRTDISLTVIHTGQHYDANMSDVFFEELAIPKPDIFLGIKAERHTEKIGKMFSALQDVFHQQKFDGTIVVGDVNSTLAGALAASRYGSPLYHIEAGLRSHDRRMPEEINRAIVDHLSDVLFTTEPAANENLRSENIPEERIRYVGNVMIESLELFWPRISAVDILPSFNLQSKKYLVATIHRVENTDDPIILKSIFEFLGVLAKNISVVLPLHPGTAAKIQQYGFQNLLVPLQVIQPLGYFEFISLVANSAGVVTDSGGIQEETTHLGVPCCTLRDNTERPITCERGSNMLMPLHALDMNRALQHLHRADFASKSIPLWDAQVSQRILDALV